MKRGAQPRLSSGWLTPPLRADSVGRGKRDSAEQARPERLRMRFLFIALAIASAAYVARASELGYVGQDPPKPLAEVTSKDKGQLPALSYVDLARAAFPEAKRRFLKGFPEGYELRVTAGPSGGGGLIVVEKIENGWITGHWYEGMAQPASDTKDVYTFSESDVTDWVIKRPNGVVEGNFGFWPLVSLFVLEQRGTGKTCDLAKQEAGTASWSEAKRSCDALSARVCRSEVLWSLASCEWDKISDLYQVIVLRNYVCCV